MGSDDVSAELHRRQDMWNRLLLQGGPDAVPATTLREIGIYGGAQGVWVDKGRTASCTTDGRGVSVGLLHTGRHYPDDLSEDGVIYHYPETSLPPTRDANEVEATKNARRLHLPVFVITRRNHSLRDVHRGWVTDWDDESRLFLITFGDGSTSGAPELRGGHNPLTDDEPFVAYDEGHARRRDVKDRPGQQRFKFEVLKRYGPRCGVRTALAWHYERWARQHSKDGAEGEEA